MAKIAFIVDEMFEDSEFKIPYERAKEAGHEPVIIGLESGKKLDGKKGEETITTEKSIDEVSAGDFDALVIPGGYSPDKIRGNEKMVAFTRSIFDSNKPVAAICHAGWMLAEADIIKGKTVTSWPSIKTDLINAGADWVDQEVVEDGNIITSRKPDDLEAFSKALLVQVESA
jgi:protease I